MEVMSATQHRIVAFIDACNRGGYQPTKTQIERWLEDPEPLSPLFGESSAWRRLMGLGWISPNAAAHIDHLVHMMWINETSKRYSSTSLGRTLLTATDQAELEQSSSGTVVIDSADPFAYARVIGQVAQTGVPARSILSHRSALDHSRQHNNF
jgi:hypothetical protein